MGSSYGSEGSGIIALDFWLIIKRGDKRPGYPKYRDAPRVRVRAGEPDLGKNERSIRIELNVPTAIFETPSLAAMINIADPGERPATIDVRAAAEAVKQAIGMDVEMRVVPFEEESDG